MPLGLRFATGGDFDDMRVVLQDVVRNIDDGAAAAFASPGTKLQRAQILESEIADDLDAFALLPFLVEIPVDVIVQRAVRLFPTNHVVLFLRLHRYFPPSRCS